VAGVVEAAAREDAPVEEEPEVDVDGVVLDAGVDGVVVLPVLVVEDG
jgi:hypothetical protein